jgi:hypothetical protein
MQQLVNEAIGQGRAAVDPAALAGWTRSYRSAALIGASQTAARSGKLNDAAEREIRVSKLKQKISGCLRTLTGARQFCAIRSYLSTAAKHGLSFFDALGMLTEGRPWMPAAA